MLLFEQQWFGQPACSASLFAQPASLFGQPVQLLTGSQLP
jgi:hypothetical protein